MVSEIPLTGGLVALVDDSDYEFLMRFKWSTYYGADKRPRYARYGVSIDGKYYGTPMHRLIMAAPQGVEVDHIDGDGFNNQRANLRLASRWQNARNLHRRDGQLKGARQIGRHSWGCSLRVDGVMRHFGTYHSREMAAKVYDAAARRLYGEFACTNFPDIDPEADAIAAAVISGDKPPAPELIVRKLSEDDVRQIRALYTSGNYVCADLAERFGVSTASVSHLLVKRTWKQIEDGLDDAIRAQAKEARRLNGINTRTAHVTPEQAAEIRRRYQPRVVTASMLASEFGLSTPCVYSIVNGYSHRDEQKEKAA